MSIDGFVNGWHNVFYNWLRNDSMCMNSWCTFRYTAETKKPVRFLLESQSSTELEMCFRNKFMYRKNVEDEDTIAKCVATSSKVN